MSNDLPTKVVAALTVEMSTHMEFETTLTQDIRPKILGMFKPYWRGDISYSQLLEALRLIGYGCDLDTDGLHQFINKGDLH